MIIANNNSKRNRLVHAADKLFYEQSVATTTLSDIAELADIPLGNVYYYFKSKESIILAVINYRNKLIQGQLEELNGIESPIERLQALVRQTATYGEKTAKFGDVLGGLCQELSKQGGHIAEAAAEPMQKILDWCEEQFKKLGKGRQAKQLATILVSRLQGISLLTLVFKRSSYTTEQADYLVRWLETI